MSTRTRNDDSCCNSILKQLRSMSNPENVKGMARYGISSENTLGVSIPALRKIAKETGKNHELAQKLWKSGIHEARLLAAFVDEPSKVEEEQMDSWVKEFDSWDICDQVCSTLFDKAPYAYAKASEWSSEKGEFVKRAGFVLMAALAVHDKQATDEKLEKFLPTIKREATDERNFVRKAVNWALRQIGKRNTYLQREALKTAKEILQLDSKSARWIANDAIRELESKQLKK